MNDLLAARGALDKALAAHNDATAAVVAAACRLVALVALRAWPDATALRLSPSDNGRGTLWLAAVLAGDEVLWEPLPAPMEGPEWEAWFVLNPALVELDDDTRWVWQRALLAEDPATGDVTLSLAAMAALDPTP